MKALEYINKTREYLDYIEDHLTNVSKAWNLLQEKCQDMNFIYDDWLFHMIDNEVKHHDLSKLSENELVQYRKCFYPTCKEEKQELGNAWGHHKKENKHHWQNWTQSNENQDIHCVHMVVDWIAMGLRFGDTAQQYYEKNKESIKLPDWAVVFIYEIFKRIYNLNPPEGEKESAE